MRKSLFAAAVVLLFASTSAPAADGDAEAGGNKAQVCAACHGPDGNSTNGQWPKLAGQHADYLVEQLKAYKTGERDDAVMAAQVANLDEKDMADVAAFFSEQALKPGKADPEYVDRGEKLYRGGNQEDEIAACIACHGPRGLGNPPSGFPRVSGQHADYVVGQLKAYKAGDRTTDMNRMMRDIASRMSEEQMRAVAEYMEGLH